MRRTSNLVLALVAVLVLALAMVAALTSARRDQAAPDTSTPAGVTQAYVAALVEGDDQTAVDLLDPALGCSAPLPQNWTPDAATLSVVSSKVSDTTATVVLQISHQTGADPLFGGSEDQRETFSLVRRDGRWLVSGEPWPIYSCKDR